MKIYVDFDDHISFLEELYGLHVSCECESRVRLLIDMGCYAIKNPNDYQVCTYSCRQCQYNRMMKDENCTYRL